MDLNLQNVTISYDRHPAIHHLSVTIRRGSLLAVVGPNGAGKTTLLGAMAGLIPISEGSFAGLDKDRIAYLPQQTQLDRTFPITVEALVASGFWYSTGIGKAFRARHFKLLDEALDKVGLRGFEHRMIGSLSGGQLQRALFARVLLQDCPVILLDEPFNAIDAKTALDLTDVVRDWHAGGRTVITVTHDLEYVRQYYPETLLLAREVVDFGNTRNVLSSENLLRAKRMCEAFDENAGWCRRDAA